jgi:DNA polymerase V
MQAAFALIDANNFYVSCERLFRPDLHGKPVIVLSNNDGCVVSRSQEAKAIGVPMGSPLFRIRREIREHRIAVFSSNYTLYGDISARMHDAIAHFSPRVEHYSIDEAFASLPPSVAAAGATGPLDAAAEMRAAVKRWTGIPTSIGVGPTKTLSKVAGDIAKKTPEGVFDLSDPRVQDEVLEGTHLVDVWGISTRTAAKLIIRGIVNARQLRDMQLRDARKLLTVVGARIVEELRGRPCLPLELVVPRKKNICCSRSFAGEVRSLPELRESVISYLSSAAEKMRRERLVAGAISVFVETNLFKSQGVYSNSATARVQPTDSTRELIPHAVRLLRAIHRPEFGYRKSGVLLLDLAPREGETRRLFGDDEYVHDRELMAAVDAINATYGRGTVWFGPRRRGKANNWHMARNRLSPRYTTDPAQLLRVRT